jgi:hypothetical protein
MAFQCNLNQLHLLIYLKNSASFSVLVHAMNYHTEFSFSGSS